MSKKYTRLEAEEECKAEVYLAEDRWICPENGRILDADDIETEDPNEYENWRRTLLGL